MIGSTLRRLEELLDHADNCPACERAELRDRIIREAGLILGARPEVPKGACGTTMTNGDNRRSGKRVG